MTNKLTVVDKIKKTLEYCDYVKDLARIHNFTLRFLVVIESAVGEQLCPESLQIDSAANIRPFLFNAVCQAALAAKQSSQNYNCLTSVKVYIETYNSEGELIDEDPIDEYEISFENGTEVQ